MMSKNVIYAIFTVTLIKSLQKFYIINKREINLNRNLKGL